jgi:cation diffusion facilitator CzcD-associated flavoprotein CzcO
MNEETNDMHFDALIIGAGFSGLYQLHRLRDDLGLNTAILEQGNGVGGTWYWNRYPGARCDSESQGYAYFFSKKLHEEWQWSERYPGHSEIRRYLNFVADNLNLKKEIFLGRKVSRCSFLTEQNLWHVQTEKNESFYAKWLVTAVGCLSSTNVPAIKGLSSFNGTWYHTGQWPHEEVSFKGQRVGQIGTGSTGIQAAPVIAKDCNHLTVFQRTANYSIPARNAPWDDAYSKWVKNHFRELKSLVKSTPSGHPFRISNDLTMEVSEKERCSLLNDAWIKGGLRFRGVFNDLLTSSKANNQAAKFIKSKIQEKVNNPETAKILTDIDHPYAAKRPPIDTNYFETFNRDNVSLVNLKADPILEISPKGIRLQSGVEHELDAIVFATGFDAMTGPLIKLNIAGPKENLGNYWRNGPINYLGLSIPGFPNLFTITGPGSPSVLSNMPVSIEQHVDWITECIRYCANKKIDSIEADEDAAQDWTTHVDETANATLLPKVKHSWYLGANIPGKPHVFMPYAGGLVTYRKICSIVEQDGYAGFSISKSKNKTEITKIDLDKFRSLSLGV